MGRPLPVAQPPGHSPSRPFDAGDLALATVMCGLAFANARIFATAQIDDAYITFRVADNLARGLGPIYNVYERVEGSSSLLSVVVLACFIRLGANALAAARFLGTAAFVGLTALTYFTVRFEAKCFPRVLAAGAALVVAASTPLAFYAMSGLETDVYAFLLTLTFSLLVVLPFRSAVAGATAGGLMAMARPEGSFFFGLLFALLLLKMRHAGRSGPRDVLRVAAAFVVPFGALTLFRLGYYHSWIPNTVRAKDGSSARFHGMGVMEIGSSLVHS
jgi:arabinofuranosyltransferase